MTSLSMNTFLGVVTDNANLVASYLCFYDLRLYLYSLYDRITNSGFIAINYE